MSLYGHVSATGFVNRANGGFGAAAYLFGEQPKNEFVEQSIRLQLRIRAIAAELQYIAASLVE